MSDFIENELELLPDPERTVNGLRDTGYNFNTAVADIVDNSIAAHATEINILVNMDPNQVVRIYIADNGQGMDAAGLINAMKYGSARRTDASSLGKFGLGLKTASTSFCRQLSLLSRVADDEMIRKVQWDLDYISQTRKWLLLRPEPSDDELELLDATANGGSGTLVVWTKVDRLLKNYSRLGDAKNALIKYVDDLKFHLRMVFQRFLSNGVKIIVNSAELTPWDPFCINEEHHVFLQEKKIKMAMPDGTAPECRLRAYVVPRRDQFSSAAAMKEARINESYQGFYVYRENRLIHFGDWLGLRSKDSHLSLLRVEFMFDHQMDDLLQIDIKKSRILLIGQLFSQLEEFMARPFVEANKRYRHEETENIHKTGAGAHEGSNKNIEQKAAQVEESRIVQTGTNKAEITNSNGTFTKRIAISVTEKKEESRIIPVETLDGNALWEPALVNEKHAVNINESHAFYKKVYGPILKKNAIVEGLDALLWALSEAENSTVNPLAIKNFEDFRMKTSLILRDLVEDLPDPEFDFDE